MDCIIDQYFTQTGDILYEDNKPYSCVLNQTDIKTNKNKFYIIQLIKVYDGYCVFIRYGRVGDRGTIVNEKFIQERQAKSKFISQFKSKTGNSWDAPFVKKEGKYFMSELSSEIKKIVQTDIDDIKDYCVLDERVQYFLSLISDKSMITETLVQMDIDVNKMPLGKISSSQLDKAYNILNEIKLSLNNQDKIEDLSSMYYTYVPYVCKRKRPPLIDNIEMIGKYGEIIEELKNIVVAVNITQNQTNMNEIYNHLETVITPLNKETELWNLLNMAVIKTNGHNKKMNVIDILEIKRNNENIVPDYGNKFLLFHGTRLTNFCSILKMGLILNPESLGVPIAGKMFGQGIYMANCVTKSLGYTSYNSNPNNIGAMFVCETDLGNQYRTKHSDYTLCEEKMSQLQCNSTHGIGKTTVEYVEHNGYKIPNKLIKIQDNDVDLNFDEFIIYNAKQMNLRFIIIFQVTK